MQRQTIYQKHDSCEPVGEEQSIYIFFLHSGFLLSMQVVMETIRCLYSTTDVTGLFGSIGGNQELFATKKDFKSGI